jgi:cytochrome o ubiquinol oxidase subunit III
VTGAVATAEPVASRHRDPHRLGHGRTEARPTPGHGTGGPASKRIIVGFGFWIFLLSDIVMFAAFFAAYAVLAANTAGGPNAAEILDVRNAAAETACLLLSSFTCGLAAVAARARNATWFYAAMSATFALGAGFLGLEAREFTGLIERGAGPTRSAFLSAFFTLVACHGLHVTAGLLWLLTMMAQVFAKGFRDDVLRRLLCFGLFWHALDIIWIAVFTVVYLMGVRG